MPSDVLKSYYQGRVLANDRAINDPIVIAVLDDLALRNFEPLPTPNEGTWNISDYD